MELTLVDYLDQAAVKYGGRDAWVYGERSNTYAELATRAGLVSRAVTGSGLQKGDRCAFLLRNCPEIIEIEFGVAAVGGITVPINFRSVLREIQHVMDDAAAKVLVFASEYSPLVQKVRELHRGEVRYVCVGEAPIWADSYEQWLVESSDMDLPRSEISPHDPFFIGYTSGTTGTPKGAAISHRGLIRNNFGLMLEYGAPSAPGHKFLTLMPMFHSNSTWFGTACVMAGASNVISGVDSFDAKVFLEAVQAHQITHTSVVPTMLKLVADLGPEAVGTIDCSSLEWILCGSAPLSLGLKTKIETLFDARLSEGYGATETGIVSSLRETDPDEKKASVGRPMIGTVVSIRDGLGTELANGQIGEVWARGETTLLLEYWHNPEATSKAFDQDGWLSVGDMGYLDSDGFLYLSDRKNDMIISGGENIYPSEVEGVLLAHEAIAEAAVVPSPDEHWGETVKAVVSLRPGHQLANHDLMAHCREHLAGYKVPKQILIVDELPKSPTGKILRRLVRDLGPRSNDGR